MISANYYRLNELISSRFNRNMFKMLTSGSFIHILLSWHIFVSKLALFILIEIVFSRFLNFLNKIFYCFVLQVLRSSVSPQCEKVCKNFLFIAPKS